MKRPRPVIWIGRARTAALAVPCPTCGAEITRPCDTTIHPAPHRERDLRAATFGFVNVAPIGEPEK